MKALVVYKYYYDKHSTTYGIDNIVLKFKGDAPTEEEIRRIETELHCPRYCHCPKIINIVKLEG